MFELYLRVHVYKSESSCVRMECLVWSYFLVVDFFLSEKRIVRYPWQRRLHWTKYRVSHSITGKWTGCYYVECLLLSLRPHSHVLPLLWFCIAAVANAVVVVVAATAAALAVAIASTIVLLPVCNVILIIFFFNLNRFASTKTIIHLIYANVNWLQELKTNKITLRKSRITKKKNNGITHSHRHTCICTSGNLHT